MGYTTYKSPATTSILNNLAATTAPGATNDSSEGYAVGSRWIDVTNDESYICVDATVDSAVWVKSSVGLATEVANTPAGNISATTVQAALNELDTEKASAGDVPKVNFAATASPTTGDDSADGYSVGSIWIDTTNDRIFKCVDATEGAAVWIELGNNGVTRSIVWQVVDADTAVETGDGIAQFPIPADLNGHDLISAKAYVKTAGTTNATTFMLHNLTDAQDMLSAAISIASGETNGSGTVNTSYDDVAEGDIIRVDCDSVSTTAPQGVWIVLRFQKP
jgi:hypothetical protein